MTHRSPASLRFIFGALAAVLAAALVACSTTPPPVTTIEGDTPTPTVTATAEATASPGPTATPTAPMEPVASTYWIPTEELPIARFTSTDGVSADLPLEVPPRLEYHIGLSGRYEIEGRGMLFYHPNADGGPGFWMRNTHINLDAAFVDADGVIISIHHMLADTDTIHRPDRAYLAGIEAPAGWYAQHGITAGARVEFLFDPPEYWE